MSVSESLTSELESRMDDSKDYEAQHNFFSN